MITLKHLVIFSLALLTCCSSSSYPTDPNERFVKQYNPDVKKANRHRKSSTKKAQLNGPLQEIEQPSQETSTRNWRNPAIMLGNAGTSETLPAFVDTSNITLPQPEEALPGEQESMAIPLNASLPNNMFDLIYVTELHPAFRVRGAEFDAITIPPKDAYGIPTELEDKDYLLVGNLNLQQDLDQINAKRSHLDNQVSLAFIKTLREARREQMLKQILKEKEDEDSSPGDE